MASFFLEILMNNMLKTFIHVQLETIKNHVQIIEQMLALQSSEQFVPNKPQEPQRVPVMDDDVDRRLSEMFDEMKPSESIENELL